MKKEFYLKKGYKKIKCVHYPLDNPKAAILIVHGLGEHIDRYEILSREMNEYGFSVFGMDHFGHGNSSGIKGMTSVEEMLEEIGIVYKKILETYPKIKIGIFGHSMGGLVVLRELEEKKREYFSAVISSPAVYVKEKDKEKLNKMNLLVKSLPFLTINNGISTKSISRNNTVVAEYENDPNVHSKISLKLADSIYRNGIKTTENLEKIKIPVLIQSGTCDEIVIHEKVREMYDGIRADNKMFLAYEGAFHEVFFDPEHGEQFRMDIIGWFRRYL